MASNQSDKNKIRVLYDTYYRMPWDKFIDICLSQGFEEVYRNDFTITIGFFPKIERYAEEEIVMVHKEKGLLLHTNSFYNKKIMDHALLYGEIRAIESMPEEERWHVCIGSNGPAKFDTREFALDVRENMIASLIEIEKYYDFVNPWNVDYNGRIMGPSFLNSTDYQKNEKKRNYDAVSARKISEMGEDAQKIMGFVPSKKLKKRR